MRRSRLLLLVVSLGVVILFGGMVWRLGWEGVGASLATLGPWLLPAIALGVIPHVLHTVGWAACFTGTHLPLRLWQLFLIRLAGTAVNQVTPTADVGGEVVRVLLLERTLPRPQAVATVVIGKASVTIAQMAYLSLGMLYLMQQLALPGELRWGLRAMIALAWLGLVGFVAAQRYGMSANLGQWLARLPVARPLCLRLAQALHTLDTQLRAYYLQHPWRFVRSCSVHFLAFVCEGLKTALVLRLLLGAQAPSMLQALTVAVAVAALDQLFFFVPGRLGAMEGVRLTVVSALGVAQIYGLAFGLVARLEHVVWSGLGLLAYGACSRYSTLLRVASPSSVSSSAPER